MLVASLQVAANKCCHAAAVPAGGPEPAAGHDPLPDQTRPLHPAPRTAAPDCPAYSGRLHPRGFLAGHDSLRLAHRRDEERTNTWNTSGMYRFFLLGTTVREGMEVKVEEVEEKEENDRGWGIERRTASPAGFGYPAGRWNGRIAEPARTSSSARCKWRIVISRIGPFLAVLRVTFPFPRCTRRKARFIAGLTLRKRNFSVRRRSNGEVARSRVSIIRACHLFFL